jgi:hypothetical protein
MLGLPNNDNEVTHTEMQNANFFYLTSVINQILNIVLQINLYSIM